MYSIAQKKNVYISMQVGLLCSQAHCLEEGMCPNQAESQVDILSLMLAHFTLIRVASAFIISQAVYICWVNCHWTQIPNKTT